MTSLSAGLKKVFYTTLSILIATSFVFWGVGDVFYDQRRIVVVAEIGDIQIEGNQFVRLYRRQTREVQELLGAQLDYERGQQLGFISSVMSEFVRRALFDNEARAMDLQASDHTARDVIFLAGEFQDERGLFSELLFRQALRDGGYSEATFVRDLKQELRLRQLVSAIGGGAGAPAAIMEPLTAFREEARSAQTVLLKPDDFDNPPDPSDAELQSWLADNPQDFVFNEYRDITYVTVTPETLSEEIVVGEDRIQQFYQERLDAYVNPERRDLEQILVKDEATARRVAEALERGGDFVVVASDIAGLDENDIDLGWNRRNELIDSVAEAVFKLNKGDVSEPVESPFGWHILRLKDIDPERRRTLEEARAEIRQALAFDDAAEAVYELIGAFEDSLAGGAALEQAAREINAALRSVTIDEKGQGPDEVADEALAKSERFLKAAFAAQPGEDSDVIESEDYGFFALRVDGVEPSRSKTFDEARAQILDAWRLEQKKKRAASKALSISDAVNAGASLEQSASDAGLKVITLKPFTRSNFLESELPGELAQRLFNAQPGQAVHAEIKEGHMVGVLTDIAAADFNDQEVVEAMQTRINRTIGDDLISQYGAHLRQRYPVTIYERALEELLL